MSKYLFPAGIALVILALAVPFGFQYRIPVQHLPLWFAAGTIVFIAGIGLLAAFSVSAEASRAGGDALAPLPHWVGSALCTMSLSLTVFFNIESAAVMLSLLAANAACLVLGLRLGPAISARLMFAVSGGIVVYLVLHHAMNDGGDMLPIVAAASREVLSGSSPYGKLFPDASSYPFVYLPGTLLAYLPLVAADYDLRILNLAALVAIVLGVEFRSRAEYRCGDRLAVGFYPLLLSPVTAKLMVYGQIWPYWMMVVALALLLLAGRNLSGAGVLGLALGTRQLAVFLAAPLAASFVGRLPIRRFLIALAVVLASYLILTLPFILWDPAFLRSAYGGAVSMAGVLLETGVSVKQVGMVSLLSSLDLKWVDLPLQIAVVVLAMVLAYRARRQPPAALLFLLGLMYVVIINFSPQVFRYYYMPGLLLMAIAYTHYQRQPGVRVGDLVSGTAPPTGSSGPNW